MVVNLANFIEYFATPISGQVTFQRQGYESDLAFAMDAKCGMYQSSPGERTPFFGAAFCAVIGGCMSLHFRLFGSGKNSHYGPGKISQM